MNGKNSMKQTFIIVLAILISCQDRKTSPAETPAVKQLMSECDNFYLFYKWRYKNDAWAYNPEKNR